MGMVLTYMELAFEQLLDVPELFSDEEFVMENLFKTVIDKVDPLRKYLMTCLRRRLMHLILMDIQQTTYCWINYVLHYCILHGQILFKPMTSAWT